MELESIQNSVSNWNLCHRFHDMLFVAHIAVQCSLVYALYNRMDVLESFAAMCSVFLASLLLDEIRMYVSCLGSHADDILYSICPVLLMHQLV